MTKKTTPEPKSLAAPPDRASRLARKESGRRVEELKHKLLALTDKYFEQSLSAVRRWLREDDKAGGNGGRG